MEQNEACDSAHTVARTEDSDSPQAVTHAAARNEASDSAHAIAHTEASDSPQVVTHAAARTEASDSPRAVARTKASDSPQAVTHAAARTEASDSPHAVARTEASDSPKAVTHAAACSEASDSAHAAFHKYRYSCLRPPFFPLAAVTSTLSFLISVYPASFLFFISSLSTIKNYENISFIPNCTNMCISFIYIVVH